MSASQWGSYVGGWCRRLRFTSRFESCQQWKLGLTDQVWTLEEVAVPLEAKNMKAKQTRRGPYKKKTA